MLYLILSVSFKDHVTATVASCMSRLGEVYRVKHCFDNRSLVCDSKQMAAEIVNFQLSPLGKQLTLLKAARDLGVILDTVSKFQRSCHGNCRFLYVAIR